MLHLYLKVSDNTEVCFTIDFNSPLTANELKKIKKLLTCGHDTTLLSETPHLDISNEQGVEIGPRKAVATAYSTNTRSALERIGVAKVRRIEKSTRYLTCDINSTIQKCWDPMTQEVYHEPLQSFTLDVEIEGVLYIPLIEEGISAFDSLEGLSFSQQDKDIYYKYFVEQEKRNPTNVELFDLLNSNCEHSRHGWFNAIQIIDGVQKPYTAFNLVKQTLKQSPDRSVIGFKDNSSSIQGYSVQKLIPQTPGKVSSFKPQDIEVDITFTAETHNFPTGVSAYPGAATGSGGRLRDQMATGKGSKIGAGSAGYCVSTLHIDGYEIPGQNPDFHNPAHMSTASQVLVDGSNGVSDYGNEFGEPLVQGFCYNFDLQIGENRCGYIKPILYSGGMGSMNHIHAEKDHPEKGMLIVQVGGPAYRIGFGGSAASSMLQGENSVERDYSAVQRGDPEMGNKVYRVVETCSHMGTFSPIASIHDQGAGGPANVLKELVEKSGGQIDIRKINIGDPTLSVLEIWICEYQERCGFLIYPDRIEEFQAICERESVPCEVLGEVTGDQRFTVIDSQDGSTPVDFHLPSILADFPQATFSDTTQEQNLSPVQLPETLTISEALQNIFKLIAVGSKAHLVHKVDRSVGGLVVQQQCVGPAQLPLANSAVLALSHISTYGSVKAQGVNPQVMIIDPAAGARLAVTEMLLNMAGTVITSIEHIKCSVNWMWAPKLPGEGAALYKAVESISELIPKLGVAIDGGKDSLSMATKVGDDVVKSPRTVVVSGYAPVPNIHQVTTPDIKKPGESALIYIDLSLDQARLGGSALAQSLSQLGASVPSVDSAERLRVLFNTMQALIQKDLVLAFHDVSDGGVITTLTEMAMAGVCGIDVNIESNHNALEKLFAEEPGIVIEVHKSKLPAVQHSLDTSNIIYQVIGDTQQQKNICISVGNQEVFNKPTDDVYAWWSETSLQLEKVNQNHCVDEERKNTSTLSIPHYEISFTPEEAPQELLGKESRIKVAVIREEGSNGDREMSTALWLAGFEPIDVTMKDLVNGNFSLDNVRGATCVGGFSFADHPESAKGWALSISEHPKLSKMFQDFRNRPDTWSFHPCNGCQMVALLGWCVDSEIPENERPRFTKNESGKFESRYTTVQIPENNSIMFKGMEGSVLPVWSNHGEGKVTASQELLQSLTENGQVPVYYADNLGNPTQDYPFNPNGSPHAIAGLTSTDGRHTIMMPHPERLFKTWQFSWLPDEMRNLQASPWLKIFQNAREWCENN